MPLNPDEYLLRRLQEGTASSAELQQSAGISQSAVSRRLRDLIASNQVIRIGSTRGTRYGMLRPIQGIGSRWPLHQVGVGGEIRTLGTLSALTADQHHFENAQAQFAWPGLSDGLPYFLQDQRPGGFLGRAVPQRYPELALPQRVTDWNDDHYLQYLTQRGSDPVGDLILGDAALNEYLLQQRERSAITKSDIADRYPSLASEVLRGGLPGSSAHGEHPKFATLIADASGPRHVIVKFSPPIATMVGQRWSDLLVTEHLAHEVLREASVPAARSRIHRFEDRTYLDMDRFDRDGLEGRIGVTSLLSIDASLYGKLDNWIAAATRLMGDGRLPPAHLELVRLAATFGELIANTDRHFGNLALYDRYDGRFGFAPVYDMLPMLFKPEHDQIIPQTFKPPSPSANTLAAFGRARSLAEDFWRRCAQDGRISEDFRRICASCLSALEALPRKGAYAYATEG